MHTVVLGIGNNLLTDDGAGVHAARRLAVLIEGRTDVEVVDGGTLSFTLAPLVASANRLIVIDAAQLNAPPGTVRVLFGREFDAFLGSAKLSVHEVSLLDLFDIARLTGDIPAQRALIAVQPGSIEWGDSPTPNVEMALAQVETYVLQLLDRWPEEIQASSSSTASALHLS